MCWHFEERIAKTMGFYQLTEFHNTKLVDGQVQGVCFGTRLISLTLRDHEGVCIEMIKRQTEKRHSLSVEFRIVTMGIATELSTLSRPFFGIQRLDHSSLLGLWGIRKC